MAAPVENVNTIIYFLHAPFMLQRKQCKMSVAATDIDVYVKGEFGYFCHDGPIWLLRGTALSSGRLSVQIRQKLVTYFPPSGRSPSQRPATRHTSALWLQTTAIILNFREQWPGIRYLFQCSEALSPHRSEYTLPALQRARVPLSSRWWPALWPSGYQGS